MAIGTAISAPNAPNEELEGNKTEIEAKGYFGETNSYDTQAKLHTILGR